MTCGYTMVFDEAHSLGLTVGKEVAERIARRAGDYAALPPTSEQHPVLVLAPSDMPGVLARLRPFVGNLGTIPTLQMADSSNAGDVARFLWQDPAYAEANDALTSGASPLTDGHMDIDSVRQGAILICPVKVPGGGVYMGDVHAMQGDGEIAGHTTDVAAEVRLQVELIKGLELDGPILLPPLEDLPLLTRPFSSHELADAERMAAAWGVELERTGPIQLIGSGRDLNQAAWNGLQRASTLLEMSLEEVRNRVTITGSVEIGRLPGIVTISLLARLDRLDRLGIGHLVKTQYGL
jgi:formamidase